jgi:hypothetical protein
MGNGSLSGYVPHQPLRDGRPEAGWPRLLSSTGPQLVLNPLRFGHHQRDGVRGIGAGQGLCGLDPLVRKVHMALPVPVHMRHNGHRTGHDGQGYAAHPAGVLLSWPTRVQHRFHEQIPPGFGRRPPGPQ